MWVTFNRKKTENISWLNCLCDGCTGKIERCDLPKLSGGKMRTTDNTVSPASQSENESSKPETTNQQGHQCNPLLFSRVRVASAASESETEMRSCDSV
jgi:hypothetical protein